MAESISNLSISVALDGSKAEAGFNQIGAKVEQFAEGIKKATASGAAFGSLVGSATFAALSKTFDTMTASIDRVGQSLMSAAMKIEKSNFQALADMGKPAEELIKSEVFKNSLTGSFAYLGEAWENLLANVGSKFAPVISKIVNEVTRVVNWTDQFIKDIGESLAGIMPENFINLEKIFMNVRIIAVDIAKTLVSALAKLAKFANDARLLGNKTAVKETIDDARGWFTNTFPGLAKAMGPMSGLFLPNKARDEIRNKRLDEARVNGDIDGINQIIEAGNNIDKLFGNTLLRLEKIDLTKRLVDPQKIMDLAGIKLNEQAPPENIFAAAMERGSMAEWESRMRDRFGAAMDKPQEKIAENTTKMIDVLKDIAENTARNVPGILPGLLEFGKGF